MIRGLASLLLLLGLLAMLPGGGGGALALDDASRLEVQTLCDPLLRRAAPPEPTDEPGAPLFHRSSHPAAGAQRPDAPAADENLPPRHPGPMRARAPPLGDVRS